MRGRDARRPRPLAKMTDQSLTRFLASDSGDIDPVETAEWREALLSLVAAHGPARARFVLDELAAMARSPHVAWSPELVTPYVNSIAVDQQPAFPATLPWRSAWVR